MHENEVSKVLCVSASLRLCVQKESLCPMTARLSAARSETGHGKIDPEVERSCLTGVCMLP